MRIGIIGLGYVGLPLALSFSKKYKVTAAVDSCKFMKIAPQPIGKAFVLIVSNARLVFRISSESVPMTNE